MSLRIAISISIALLLRSAQQKHRTVALLTQLIAVQTGKMCGEGPHDKSRRPRHPPYSHFVLDGILPCGAMYTRRKAWLSRSKESPTRSA